MKFFLITLLSLSIFSCQKSSSPPVNKGIAIALINPGFEDGLQGWGMQTAYTGTFGFRSLAAAKRSGKFGLDFYASQPNHFPGALQETPWNGKLFQVIPNLVDGKYTLYVYTDAVGTGMFIYANGGGQDIVQAVSNRVNTQLHIDFTVTGGVATIGFLCLNASGTALEAWSPYLHADDVELYKNP